MPDWRAQKGQRRKTGCSQHSSSSKAWCQCLHSTEQYSWEGGQPEEDHEKHPEPTASPYLMQGINIHKYQYQ